ncbi:MAG: selenocysteine-specific translation elongation factor [Rhizobiales bacterium 68-8]|nr:MAG: selenocysteine-specific translation elongation factor [Rhizobiales bacterium 68-8]
MIIGTAGHIDHGKTALVKALTGVDADRLREEKERGITIDLGFAYLPVGDGCILGFVDVPGHDRFVRNMLAGATGIDFVLLVVAADDGVMPQTREHLDIVTLLGLTRGAVALTKADLVPPARLAEVAGEVETLCHGTPFAGTRMFPVSPVTGEGVEALRDALAAAARSFSPRGEEGLFRLAVDRCFSIRGAGTVVTGAVLSGSVSVGDGVTVSPSGLRARVRGIHAQNRAVARGQVGERCALNLVGDGVGVQAIGRGDVVLDAAAHAPASRIDAELRLLAGEPRALAHWTPVRLHHAAAEVGARAALLQEGPIVPGATGRVQLVLERPVAAAVGDRFVIRDTSGARTMGGGRFLDLRGPDRRRRSTARLAQLDALSRESLADVLAGLLDLPPFAVDVAAFARDRALGLELRDLLARVPHVRASSDGHDLAFSPATWKTLSESARALLEDHHRTHPHLLGPGIAWLAARLEPRVGIGPASVAIRTLVVDGMLATEGGVVRLPGHRLALDGRDYALWQRILPLFSGEARFRPPLGRECAGLLGEREPEVRRVLKAMARQQRVVELAPDRFFLDEAVREMAGIAAEVAAARPDGLFSAADFRDRLRNGRKVAIEILEYFDRSGLTTRRGDLRGVVPQRIADHARRTNGIMEENRPRWGVRTSNPGGAVSQSRVGSTPTLFRHPTTGPARGRDGR